MTLAERSAKVLFIRVASLAVQVPVSIMIARFLGVEGKGLYTLLTVVPWLVSFMLLGGMDTAHAYLLSSRRAGLKAVLIQSLLCVLVFSLAGIPIYLFLVVPRVIQVPAQVLLLVSALLIPLALSRYFVHAILIGFERVVGMNFLQLVSALSMLALIGVFLGLWNFGLIGALVCFGVSQALMLPLGLYWIAKNRRVDENPPRDNSEPGRKLKGLSLLGISLAYGLKGHLAGVMVTLNQRFDIFLLGALSTPREVGLYAVSVALAEAVWHVPMTVQLILFPRTAAVGREKGARMLPRACRMTLLLTLGLAITLGVLGSPLILFLYGKSFLPAVVPLIALLPGVVGMGIASVFGSYFAGVDRRHYQSISATAAFALCLVLNLVLIPKYGALGAALASTASYLLQMVISLSLYRRLGELSYGNFFVPRLKDIEDLIVTFKDMFKK
ncbi:flippase [Gemmatimonadota bacterium]